MSGNGVLSRISKVLSPVAFISSICVARCWPMPSRFIQRAIEATQSCPRTGWPSWNLSPSRRPKRQSRFFSEISAPAHICGDGARLESLP